MVGSRRIGARLQLLDPFGDLLPGLNAEVVAFERQRSDLLGNMERRLLAVDLENRAGTSPNLPVAQRHRWSRQ